MSRLFRYRRGHDLEGVYHHFGEDDLADLKPKKVFNEKWIIVKKVENRGTCHCYQVCDKAFKVFGILYIEIGDKTNINTITSQIEFSLQQFVLGYSHRFTNVIDSNIINNHVFYMVQKIRPGPTIHQLLSCLKTERMSPITASFLAIDILSVMELLNSSGHVLRNFDSKQWKLDIKTRTFYLDDVTDITVSSDKRHRSFDEIHILNAETLDLAWTSSDILYAPVSYIINGPMHRMSELDILEMFLYILSDWTRGKLPWRNSKDQQRTLELKKQFLEAIPNPLEEPANEQHTWFNTAVRNIAEHLKVARRVQEKLEKQAVRGGAWCPNGPRAGALLSIINYRRLIEDFHKIVCNGKPEWSLHWRDVKMDWDNEVELTDDQKQYVKKYEKRQKCVEIADEWQRLRATRMHYTIMKEHGDTEKEKNQIAIDRYLNGHPDDEEAQEEMDRRIDELKERRRVWREQFMRDTVVDEVKQEDIKEEIKIDEEEFTSASKSSMTSKQTVRQTRKRRHESDDESEDVDDDEEEEEESGEKEIKEEDPDEYFYFAEEPKFEIELEMEHETETTMNMMTSEEREIKEEEPDDFDN